MLYKVAWCCPMMSNKIRPSGLQTKVSDFTWVLNKKEPSPTKIIQKVRLILYISGRLYFSNYKRDYGKLLNRKCTTHFLLSNVCTGLHNKFILRKHLSFFSTLGPKIKIWYIALYGMKSDLQITITWWCLHRFEQMHLKCFIREGNRQSISIIRFRQTKLSRCSFVVVKKAS